MENFYNIFRKYYNYQPGTIIEIGSRDGHDAEELRSLSELPANRVFIVEPNPESAKLIRTTYPYFKVFEFAIFNKVGVANFNAIPHLHGMGAAGTSSLMQKNPELLKFFNLIDLNYWAKTLTITGRMLLELIDTSNIDLLKIDVEGATYEVLESFGDDIRQFKMMHIETEKIEMWSGQHSMPDVKSLLTYYGFVEEFTKDAYTAQEDSIWRRIDI